ncbi:hypothetical protein [Leeuwenhoekiella nanhaiensis]|uniref:Uncharacterized protein n=1 Tax=Leeuwenhoekiella nanhaiensis TaxID=1655491 RepID=A0A2G1VM91_9FLAO|nr:hypothetical protein [Leeuwenhoekiella nanhaiensis]PHQ27881.1 hypothetical protein CJ305_17910 [Leeuwenhoekiella nanhaiensis]
METVNNQILELKGEQIGSKPSKQLLEYLKKYTTGKERAKASVNSGVGIHTIISLVVGRATITEQNIAGLIELVHLAIENCVAQAAEYKDAGAKLRKLLKTA